MSFDDFENKLRRQPMREIPPQWRRDILAAARLAAPAAPRWREFLWPCPQAWASLAAVWALILALHLASTSETPQPMTLARAQWREVQRQDEMLARLLAPPEPIEPAEPPKTPSHAQILLRHRELQFV